MAKKRSGESGEFRTFQLLNGRVLIGTESCLLGMPTVELGYYDDVPRLSFLMEPEQAQKFAELWGRQVHSERPSGEFPESGVTPGGTKGAGSSAKLRNALDVNYVDVKYTTAIYGDLRGGTAAKTEVTYTGVTYYEAKYTDVIYSASQTKQIQGPQIDAEAYQTLTLIGSTRDGKQLVVYVDGIGEATTKESSRYPDLIDVSIQLSLTLPLEQLLWIVESE